MAVGGRGGGEGEDNDDEVEYHELTHSSISPSLQTVHDVNAFFHSIQIGDLYVPQKQGLINDGSNAAISSKRISIRFLLLKQPLTRPLFEGFCRQMHSLSLFQ
jgi:hypothetical protein